EGGEQRGSGGRKPAQPIAYGGLRLKGKYACGSAPLWSPCLFRGPVFLGLAPQTEGWTHGSAVLRDLRPVRVLEAARTVLGPDLYRAGRCPRPQPAAPPNPRAPPRTPPAPPDPRRARHPPARPPGPRPPPAP